MIFYMGFLNASLVVFGEKKQRRNKNKQIKTLNTLLYNKREEVL